MLSRFSVSTLGPTGESVNGGVRAEGVQKRGGQVKSGKAQELGFMS